MTTPSIPGTKGLELPGGVFVPQMKGGGNTSAATTASGAVFIAFPAQPCKQLTVVNNTGTDIEVQELASGVALPIINGTMYPFYGLNDASDLAVRRIDQSATPVTVKARWEG